MSSGSGQGTIPVPGPVLAQSLDVWSQNMSVIHIFDHSLPNKTVIFHFCCLFSFLIETK